VTIEEALVHKLTTTSTITTLIGTRIYPLVFPAGATMPCLVYQRISTPRIHTHEGASGLAQPRFQLTCWSATYGGAKALANAVREALDGFKGSIQGVQVGATFIQNELDQREADTKLYSVIQDYTISHQE
jgi:hypothetical protein